MGSQSFLIKQKYKFLLLLILLVAIFFRFWHLEQVPPGLYPDVAINGNDALDALQSGHFKIFYSENNGREGLFINFIALSFYLFGASIWAIKIVPAVIGVFTVLGLYFLSKQLFLYLGTERAEKIALLSAFFISVSFWHVNFSRLGFRAITVPFCLVWSFYFLFKLINGLGERRQVLNEGRRSVPQSGTRAGLEWEAKNEKLAGAPTWHLIFYAVSAGLFFGLGFHTYIAFRIAPLILIPVFLIALIKYWCVIKNYLDSGMGWFKSFIQSYFKDGWCGWDLFVVAIIIAALPMAMYFFQHPADFMGRTGQVSILASENPAKALFVSAAKTLGMFNIWGDCNWRHNYACRPMLLWPTGIFFLVGLTISLSAIFNSKKYRQKNWPVLEAHWTLLFWFGAMLMPAIMTNEGLPHALRTIGAIPPVFIWAGFGFWWLCRKIKLFAAPKIDWEKNRYQLFITCLLFLSLLVYVEFQKYFLDWGQRSEVRDNFTQRLVDIGNYLNSLPAEIKKYIVVNENGVAVPYPNGISMPAQTIIFIERIEFNKPRATYLASEQTDKIELNSAKTIVIPLKYDGDLFQGLQQKFPKGEIEILDTFSIFKINF
jgi:4-amino-4-deoxy-L-arabinose transferase-like glycosyltransferase